MGQLGDVGSDFRIEKETVPILFKVDVLICEFLPLIHVVFHIQEDSRARNRGYTTSDGRTITLVGH